MNEPLLICGLDLETDGLDIKTGHITELGYVVKEVGAAKAGVVKSELLYDEKTYGENPITPEIEKLTKITNAHLRKWGRDPYMAFYAFLSETRDVDYFVAHNGVNFDFPFLLAKLGEYGLTDREESHPIYDRTRWIDSQADIEHGFKSTHLNYIAAEHGFLNPFPHAALFDVMTMLRIVDKHDFNEVVTRAKIPWVVVQALVSFDDKDKAKARRYRWQEPGNGKVYPKAWVKLLKADKVADEQKECRADGFDMRTPYDEEGRQ